MDREGKHTHLTGHMASQWPSASEVKDHCPTPPRGAGTAADTSGQMVEIRERGKEVERTTGREGNDRAVR